MIELEYVGVGSDEALSDKRRELVSRADVLPNYVDFVFYCLSSHAWYLLVGVGVVEMHERLPFEWNFR